MFHFSAYLLYVDIVKKMSGRMLGRPQNKRARPVFRQMQQATVEPRGPNVAWHDHLLALQEWQKDVPCPPHQRNDDPRFGLLHQLEHIVATISQIGVWYGAVVPMVSPVEVGERCERIGLFHCSEYRLTQFVPSSVPSLITVEVYSSRAGTDGNKGIFRAVWTA